MNPFRLRRCLTAIAFCLLLLQTGCVRIGPQVENNIVSQHIGDPGITKLQESTTSSITVPTGLPKSPVTRGSVFLYDNPVERWEATGVDNWNITWRSGNGDTKLTTLSMIMPALRWEGGRKSGRRVITDVSGSLHPLEKGARITFREDVLHTRPPEEYSGCWECEVQGKVSVTVQAGTFNTWQILCKRDGREHVLVNYAEELGNNVRIIRISENDNQTVVRQLMAVSLLKAEGKKTSSTEENRHENKE